MDWTFIVELYTVLAFYIAWMAFFVDRSSKLQKKMNEKMDILKSVGHELDLMKCWFGSSYGNHNYQNMQDPWHSFHMVYGLGNNISIQNLISLKSVSILSEELLGSLVTLNQKLGGFEQHVNRLVKFNTSDPVVATKAFYYYDRYFSKYDRPGKWIEFEKLTKKLSLGKRLIPEIIHLLGSVRILKDLHVIGIGSENEPSSLRYTYGASRALLEIELSKVREEAQFKQSTLFVFLDTVVATSFILGLIIIWIKIGGGYMSDISSAGTPLIMGGIFIASLALGLIKYGSIADSYKDMVWQSKFVEIWNDFVNFFIVGLIGYYFLTVRWPMLLGGASVNSSDFVLLVLFIMGIFGHLCVMSKNVTHGVESILKRILGRD